MEKMFILFDTYIESNHTYDDVAASSNAVDRRFSTKLVLMMYQEKDFLCVTYF